jgi:hypothetical protein
VSRNGAVLERRNVSAAMFGAWRANVGRETGLFMTDRE